LQRLFVIPAEESVDKRVALRRNRVTGGSKPPAESDEAHRGGFEYRLQPL